MLGRYDATVDRLSAHPRPTASLRLAGLFALLGAVVLHTAWDATGSPVLRIVVAAVSVGALLTLVVLTHRSHARRTITAA